MPPVVLFPSKMKLHFGSYLVCMSSSFSVTCVGLMVFDNRVFFSLLVQVVYGSDQVLIEVLGEI